MSSSALPLKLAPASTPVRSTSTSEVASGARTPTKHSVAANPGEISSPHELTAFVSHINSDPPVFVIDRKVVSQVETLLEQLDAKFDEMSSQILDRSESFSPLSPSLVHSDRHIPSGTNV